MKRVVQAARHTGMEMEMDREKGRAMGRNVGRLCQDEMLIRQKDKQIDACSVEVDRSDL